MDVKALVAEMTLEEKAGLLSGADFWNTKAVERLGIPSMMLTDGPHGLRKQAGASDHLGIMDAIPATCFPSAAGLACSWDRSLIGRVGEALADECLHEEVSVLLGPGANIKRSPLCGRNLEYFSEDPTLSGELAAAHIKGVQRKGVGTSLKHFAVNNQETRRMTIDARVEDRPLREIYLASFEQAVKSAKPDTVMCSYNRVNGVYASENSWLLTQILRDEWGFEGFVVSDWGAVNDRVKGVAAGLDLEMPSSRGMTDAQVVEAVRNGTLPESQVDQSVIRILNVLFKTRAKKKPDEPMDASAHHALARETAAQCAVLLKNEGTVLPLAPGKRVAVVGGFARTPRYQGGGSSHIKPTRVDDAMEELTRLYQGAVSYCQGYTMDQDDICENLISEAVENAAEGDVAILFVGLPDAWESEGYDRKHLRLPDCHNALIEAVAAVSPKTVVVLSNGSPVEMPWLGKVDAVIEGYLGGQAWGGAMADILTGRVNPGGKLAETFPKRLANNPSTLHFPGDKEKVVYHEGVFVGYRWYETMGIEPLFPFGFGLSYTTFALSDLRLDRSEMTETETLTLSVTVTNTGAHAGSETVQVYVADPEASVKRPVKELKAFEKVFLQSGESKTVFFELGRRAFAYWSEKLNDWRVESGRFDILVGTSSSDISCNAAIQVSSDVVEPVSLSMNTTLGDLLTHPKAGPVVQNMLTSLMGPGGAGSGLTMENPEMMQAMMNDMPLRTIVSFFGPGLDLSALTVLMG